MGMTEQNESMAQQTAEEKKRGKRPVIGLVPLYDEFKDSYWMLPGYMIALEESGAIPVMMPLTADEEAVRQLAEQLDGFVLTGGHEKKSGRCAELFAGRGMRWKSFCFRRF